MRLLHPLIKELCLDDYKYQHLHASTDDERETHTALNVVLEVAELRKGLEQD